MSDTYRRYSAIKRALLQLYHPQPTGHREKHLNTLCALICGLIGGKQAHLPSIADNAPSNGANQESLIKRLRRFLQSDAHTLDGWFLPVARELLTTLATAAQPLTLIMDGSLVGRGCIALMVSVVYHGRALPLCWIVVRGAKGHFPTDTHCALLAQVQELMPPDAAVVFLGDGEFDSIELQATLERLGWLYVCRTASNILFTAYGVELHVSDLAPVRDEGVAVTPAWMTAALYGPVTLIALWEEQYSEPIYLVTTMVDLDEAVLWYKKRAHIETFFCDLKTRGFHIHKSHLSDPKRLCRLLMAACLAYVWVVYLGVCATRQDWMQQLHRPDRCDLSLFRLGLRLLARCLKEQLPIPEGFLVPATLPLILFRTFAKREV